MNTLLPVDHKNTKRVSPLKKTHPYQENYTEYYLLMFRS